MAVTGFLTTTAPASAAEPARDGASQLSAAASCWEIKQNVPSAQSGKYWLVTPALVAPQQFYCDMVTDGGGWVLVGRGREGWRREYEGVRTTEVANNVDSPAGFVPAQLSSRTIDGLLNNTAVSSLSDGIRLRRATNTAGSSWQEVRFTIPKRDRWVWTFGGEHAVGTYRFDSRTGSGGTTASFGSDNSYRRVNLGIRSEQNYNIGWAFGSNIAGSPDASSYLWSASSGVRYAEPFTQVWLRPELLTADMDYPAIPDSGTSVQQLPVLPSNVALNDPWGVAELADDVEGELYVEVSAFTQIGSRVYVGGNFKYAQKAENSTGTDKVLQPYLAAFDVNTGQFDPNFRPVLDGRVKALAGMPDGTLVAAGYFTQANGSPAAAIVGLDAVTGATSQTWTAQIENRITGGIPAVRAMDVQGDYLYLAGSFTHISGGPSTSGVYSRNGARLSVVDGTPDGGWNPAFDGTALGVEASSQGDRVYFAGYFTLSNGQAAGKAAVISADPGAGVIPFNFIGSDPTRANYQFTVSESGDRFYIGGAEHSVFGYDRNTLALKSGNIAKSGGDFQTSTAWQGLLFAGCHCDDYIYSDAYTWREIGSDWTQGDKLGHVAVWDAATGTLIPDFNPIIKGDNGYGAWATMVDTSGRLWVGGDFKSAVTTIGPRWVGNFMRFPLRDSAAPAAPSGLSGTRVGADLALSWQASPGGGSSVRYEVLQGDRVIGSTTTTGMTLPGPATDARYFVRAVDPSGNRSASTPVLNVAGFGTGVVSDLLVTEDAQFAYRWSTAALPAEWTQRGFDDSSWSRGPGPVGYGSELVGTNVAAAGFPATRPLSIQGRTTFEVADPAELSGLQVTTYADDGVVVYVNGTEVGRSNLGSGTVTQNSYATAAPRTASARTAPVTFPVPVGLLQTGTNVLAVQANANYRTTPDMAFAVSLRTQGGTTIEVPSAPTGVSATPADASAVVSWSAPADDGGSAVTGYTVTASPGGATCTTQELSCTVAGLTNGTAYTFTVVAANIAGDSASSAASNEITPDAAANPVLLAEDAQFAYRWSTAALPSDWNEPGFDDDSWSRGTGPVGYGSDLVGTNVAADGFPATRPLSIQGRTTFQVPDPASLGAVTVTTYADDGVIVYVNGTEVGRSNLGPGAVTQNSYATAATRTPVARTLPVTFPVPASLLQAGTNVVAVQANANYRSTPDMAFAVSIRNDAGVTVEAPGAPTGVTAVPGNGSVDVTWAAPADDGGAPVTGYTVTASPGGATCTATGLTCTVGGLTNGTPYTFTVVATNIAGDSSPSAPSSQATPSAVASPVLVAEDAQFAYRWDTAPLAADWITPGFDDGSWSRGAGPVGYGSSLVGTNVAADGFPATRPLSIQGRATFQVVDPAAQGDLVVTTYADDGVIVYVNGTEVARSNLGTGTVTQNSYATAAPRTSAARTQPVTFTVPVGLLQVGTNVLAVQVSANYRSTPDLAFAVSLQQAQ